MKLQPFTFRLLMLILLYIVLNACKKELPKSVEAQPTSKITVQDARSWLKDNKPDLNLGSNWNNPVMLDVKNGNKILKVRLNETLYQKKTWVLRDVLFQRDSLGKIQAVGYKIFVDTSYFTNKTGANLPLADKRSYINDADFTGKVVVYTLDNQAIVGWKYLNGKVQSNLVLNMHRPGQGAVAIKHPDAEPICEGGGLDDEVTCNPTGVDEPVPFDGGQNGHPLNEVPIVSTPVVPTWTYLPTNPAINNSPGSIPVGNPSGGGSSGNTNSREPTSFQYVTAPSIDLNKYFKCFSIIPDVGASYSVQLNADLPVNGDPSQLVTLSTTPPSPGHAFITLTKSNGSTTVTQSFGFYPSISVLSLTASGVGSKINDDGGHNYDATISMNNISLAQFQTLIDKSIYLAGHQSYDINDYNCTDYALEVFNSIRKNDPISVSDWKGQNSGFNYGRTPNGLYNILAQRKSYGDQTISLGAKNAPAKRGSCN